MTNFQNYQYKNEKQQKQQEQEQYNSSTTSTTTIHTEPGVFPGNPLINMQIEKLAPLYTDIFGGRGIPHVITQFFARLIRCGMEPAVIASAINATAWARVPTPYYMRAILQRYLAEGIMTEAQLNHDMDEQLSKRREQRDSLEESMYL